MSIQCIPNCKPKEFMQPLLPGINSPYSVTNSLLIKSPLRYPGGKSRAVKQILAILPQNLERLCSPFVGGGSVELALASLGVQVYAYDTFHPLVNFWQVLLSDAHGLADRVWNYYPMSKDNFYAMQKKHTTIPDKKEMAAVFFAINRSSFSGTTLSGGMSPGHRRFTETSIEKLRQFKTNRFHVAHADFMHSIRNHTRDFLYLDPPYYITSVLYGKNGDCHKNFDHENLASLLRKRKGWLLSYNDCETVRMLYRGHRFLSPQWTYGMNKSKASNEVFILSTDFPSQP